MITKEEWAIIAPALVPGCYCGYNTKNPRSTFLHHKEYTKAVINPDLTMSFPTEHTYTQRWNQYSEYLYRLVDFHFPDGSSMLTHLKYVPPTKEQSICIKIKALDTKFKNKTFPKCITKSLLRSVS